MTVGAALLGMLLPFMQPTSGLIADPGGPAQAAYLIVAADAFADDCNALLAHRAAGGRSVGLVRFADVRRTWPGRSGPEALVACLRHARADWGTQFVLLVGDVTGSPECVIPWCTGPAAYVSDQFASSRDLAHDWDYATLGGPEPVLHVGRFPVQTRDELAVMIAKTIAYETTLPAGEWQARLRFVAGPFGGAPMIDRVLETQLTRLLADNVPPAYDLEVAYANPTSPYCPYPPLFHDNAVRMLNEGALLYCYAGHGTRHGLDSITWKQRTIPFLEAGQAGEVAVTAGLPVMAAMACWTAALDTERGDCLAEALLKRPAGPVAYLGATRICQPYGNALLGRALVGTVFSAEYPTLGEAVTEAERRLLAPEASEARRQLDALAAMVQGAPALEPIRRDTVRHYLLLGDPALALRRPRPLADLQATADGAGVLVQCAAPFAREARVSLRVSADRAAHAVPPAPSPDAPDVAAAMTARYRAANDRLLTSMAPVLDHGAIQVRLPLVADFTGGTVFARVVAWDDRTAAVGAAPLTFPAAPH